jgi:Ca2+-binding RTX toxin-like protein
MISSSASYEDEAIVNLTTGSATAEGCQDVIVGIENLSAGSGSVVFIGDAGPNELSGNEGRDRIRGRGGDDMLRGAELPDRLNGGLEKTPATGLLVRRHNELRTHSELIWRGAQQYR